MPVYLISVVTKYEKLILFIDLDAELHVLKILLEDFLPKITLAHKKKWSVHWAPPIYGHGFRPAQYKFQVCFSRPPSNFE